MKRDFWLKQFPVIMVVAVLALTITSWQTKPGKNIRTTSDTIPKNKVNTIDDALQQLDKSMQELQRILQAKDWDKEMKEALDKAHFDSEKMKVQLNDAMNQIDSKKMQDQIQKAMKDVDFEKMKTELQGNLDKMDMKELKDEIEKAVKEIDLQKIQTDINTSISKIDMDKIKVELDKVKEIDFKGIEDNLKKMEPEIKKSMQDAKGSIDKAKKEMMGYKSLIDGLDKDGLIDKNKNYTIEYKIGALSINGKKQSADVVKKYNSFLNGHKNFTIKKNEDNFNIDNE
jgi:DNA repair exonuclease SbcCD ATPase subunit